MLSLMLTGMATYAFFRAFQVFRLEDLIYFVVGIPFVAVFATLPVLAYRDVELSDAGVGRAFPGTRTRIISWEKIVAVRCGVISPVDHSVGSYHLQTRAGSPFGGVRIMSMIDDVDQLVARIDSEVKQRGIPVSAWDVNKLITLNQLPRPKKGAAAWT